MDDISELDLYDVNCDNINEILLKKENIAKETIPVNVINAISNGIIDPLYAPVPSMLRPQSNCSDYNIMHSLVHIILNNVILVNINRGKIKFGQWQCGRPCEGHQDLAMLELFKQKKIQQMDVLEPYHLGPNMSSRCIEI